MKNLYRIDQIKSKHHSLVGEEIVTLSQLVQLAVKVAELQNYPILPAFVIDASSFSTFLQNINNSESLLADFPHSSFYININNYKNLQLLAKKARQEIIAAPFPQDWTENLFQTVQQLNSTSLILSPSIYYRGETKNKSTLKITNLFKEQIGHCTSESLSLAVKKTWAELFSARSLFYCQREGIELEKINLAILIQPLVEAEASGTVEISPKQFIIESTWGLEMPIINGEVQPDRYEVDRETGKILTQQLGNKIRAYRPTIITTGTDIVNQNCLEAYLLKEEEQRKFSLDNNTLVQLIELLQNLTREEQYNSCRWTLSRSSKFCLTQSHSWASLTAGRVTEKDEEMSGGINNEQPTINNQQQFYITQISPVEKHGDTTIKQESETIKPPLVKGNGASSGVAIAPVQIISGVDRHLQTIPSGRILVTKSITPDWLPLLRKAAAVVAEVGGMTSHVAIIARELGIPAIVGAKDATQLLKTGELILIDGEKGEIYPHSKKNSLTNTSTPLFHTSQQPIPDYLIGTKLLVNLSQPNSIAKAAALPVDGVGLIRSELMLLELLSSHSLTHWRKKSQQSFLLTQLTESITQFAAAFAPRPVFYRSLDWPWEDLTLNASEPSTCSERSLTANDNILGYRGTYNYLLDSTFFDLELQALKQVRGKGYKNINLILPFVRSLEEFTFCRRRVEKIGLDRQESFQLWIAAEVPSVIFLLPEYVRAGVQGIAISTNDFSQLILGIDREKTFLHGGLNELNPALLKAIQQLINLAKSAEIPCSICGEAPVIYPDLIDKLVRWGITSISVEPEAVGKTYRAIARAEKRLLLERAK